MSLPMMSRAGFVLATAAFLFAIGTEPMRAEAQRSSCADVIKELDRVVGKRGSYRPDPVRVARKLGVEPAWVAHCSDVYGRRLTKSLRARSDEEREELEERWETDQTTTAAQLEEEG